MRVFACVLAASIGIAGAQAEAQVASMNLCTDELLLTLAAPHQIASVTHLSHMPEESPLWRTARRYPRNDGTLLAVLRHRPALVLTMGGGPPALQRVSRRMGVRTVDVPYATTLDDSIANIRLVARAIGRVPAGEAWVRRTEALRRTAPRGAHDTIWLGGGGQSVAADGLEAAWLRLAGLRQRALPQNRVSLEELVARPPAIAVRSDYRARQFSRNAAWLQHPLARRVRAGRSVQADGRRWTCMGPPMVQEILRLRREIGR